MWSDFQAKMIKYLGVYSVYHNWNLLMPRHSRTIYLQICTFINWNIYHAIYCHQWRRNSCTNMSLAHAFWMQVSVVLQSTLCTFAEKHTWMSCKVLKRKQANKITVGSLRILWNNISVGIKALFLFDTGNEEELFKTSCMYSMPIMQFHFPAGADVPP